MAKATLVYIIDPDTQEVLMAKRGAKKVGVGYWFGYGGKIEEGETPEDCAYRETLEESGGVIKLKKENLERVVLMQFFNKPESNPHTDEPVFEVICFRIFQKKSDVGSSISTEEMVDPTWFPVKNIPWNEMKPGDELFVPHIISGTPVKGWLWFGPEGVKDSDINTCSTNDLVI